MKQNHIRRYLPVAILVVLSGIVVVYLVLVSNEGESELTASGTVEQVEIVIAPETSGRVEEVFVEKGQYVDEGEPLFCLDDALLRAQQERVYAAGEQAITIAERQLILAEQELEDLHENWLLVAAQAQFAWAQSWNALDEAETRRQNQQEGYRASETTLKNARSELTLAESALKDAKSDYNRVPGSRSEDVGKAAAYKQVAAAQQRYDAALRSYNWYSGYPDEIDQAILDADVALAEANLLDAANEWEKWKNGPDRDALELAEANVDVARAQLAFAKANAIAESEMIDLQLERLIILAPASGIVLNRDVEPGEVIPVGAPALTLGQQDHLTITVYVPEDRYGEISLGGEARVTVDSFPDQAFKAVVVRIADKAEFTPRNVQTEEGRRTTVFAVELSVIDPSRKLKPGMPADVRFKE